MAVIAKVSYQRQKNNENDSLHIFSFSYVQQSLSANFVFQSNIGFPLLSVAMLGIAEDRRQKLTIFLKWIYATK